MASKEKDYYKRVKLKKKITIGYIRFMLKMLSMLSAKRSAAKAFKIFSTPFIKTTLALPPLFDNAERLVFAFDKYQLVGYRWKKHGAKKALIAHGFESTVRNFDRYISIMIEKGYEVVTFDAPAHGESEGHELNALIYKNMIEALSENFGPFQIFLGHSFGGLAISLALENLAHTVETKVVLLAPATETSTSLEIVYELLKLNKKTREEVEKLIIEIGSHPSSWYSIARAMKNIQARVIWIHDIDDDITPLRDVQPIIDSGNPRIEFMITEGLGHRRIYRDEKVKQAVKNFL